MCWLGPLLIMSFFQLWLGLGMSFIALLFELLYWLSTGIGRDLFVTNHNDLIGKYIFSLLLLIQLIEYPHVMLLDLIDYA